MIWPTMSSTQFKASDPAGDDIAVAGLREFADLEDRRTWSTAGMSGPLRDAANLVDALLVERQQVAALLARAEVGWADAVAERQQLIGGIEDYLLWKPGRAGHAEAHRKLAALVAVDKAGNDDWMMPHRSYEDFREERGFDA